MCDSIAAASILPGKFMSGHTRAFKKKRLNSRPCGQFLLANERAHRSYYDGQMSGPIVHPIIIQIISCHIFSSFLLLQVCFSCVL